jgi:hypothetical protein
MKKDEYQDLLEKLPELTQEQMADIRRRVRFLKEDKSNGVPEQDWLLDGILSVLKERGLEPVLPSPFRIRNSRSFGGFETQSDRVRNFLDIAIPNMNVMEHKILGRLCAIVLAKMLDEWPIEVSLDHMLFHISRIPEALDKSFPGYIESGMLHLLVRRRQDSGKVA